MTVRKTTIGKSPLFRFSALLLICLIFFSILPVGCTADAADDDFEFFKEYTELKKLCEQMKDSEKYRHAGCETRGFHIEEDLTLPSRLQLQFVDLVIPQGITLTVSERESLLVTNLKIDGTLINHGEIRQSLWGSDKSVRVEVSIGPSGRIENDGGLSLANPIPGEKIQNSGTYTVKREENLSCGTLEDLKAATLSAAADPGTSYQVSVAGAKISLTDNLTIPKNLTLYLTRKNDTLIIPEKSELELFGNIHLRDTRIEVLGTLTNEGSLFSYGTGTRIDLEADGRYQGQGSLSVYEAPETFFPLSGMNRADFERSSYTNPVSYRLKEAVEETPIVTANPMPSAPAVTAAPTVTETPSVTVPPSVSTPAATEKPKASPSPVQETPAPIPGSLEYRNPETGYQVMILDELGLLSERERTRLLEDMKPITEYGHVAFWSTEKNASNEVEQARLKRRELFGLDSGTILVINMKIRKISIQSYGLIYDTVTISRANTITNNVRNYLTRQQYYQGAKITFEQINRLLEGGRIPQPMKYLSNAVIALTATLILLLPLVFRHASSFDKPERFKLIQSGTVAMAAVATAKLRNVRREYHPPKSSSSSGSSCSSCSSGGSSCSSCGGGGSSSF